MLALYVIRLTGQQRGAVCYPTIFIQTSGDHWTKGGDACCPLPDINRGAVPGCEQVFNTWKAQHAHHDIDFVPKTCACNQAEHRHSFRSRQTQADGNQTTERIADHTYVLKTQRIEERFNECGKIGIRFSQERELSPRPLSSSTGSPSPAVRYVTVTGVAIMVTVNWFSFIVVDVFLVSCACIRAGVPGWPPRPGAP